MTQHLRALVVPSSLRALCCTVLACITCVGVDARAQAFSERITFRFRSDQITYQGPITSAWLMLDVEGGRNKVAGARRMTCNTATPKECSLTLDVNEGNYIYVYVVNADQFVDMSDPALNPDDIPDSNFFRDPSPRDSGFCGQFSTDNCLFVRNPNRPVFDSASFAPGHGALVTTSNVALSINVRKGADGKALQAGSVKAFVEDAEPIDLRYSKTPPPTPRLVEIPGATLVPTATGGTVQATWNGALEGFHRVFFDVQNVDGLAADRFTTSVLVNRDNQPPIAHAGGTVFTEVGQEVIVDGSLSEDPDHIGFVEYRWRIVEQPQGAQVNLRCVDEELIPRDGFGKPVLDDSGNPRGDACTRSDPGPLPRFSTQTPGRYVLGLSVRDYGADGGLTSGEATAEVIVVPSFNLAARPRVEGAVDGNTITIDGSLSQGTGAARFFADADNPAPLTFAQSDRTVTFPRPSTPGAYLVHLTIGDSYPATAMVVVDANGGTRAFDLARPPKDWRSEKVLYLGFVREFFDADGDGEGDILGMIDKLEYLSELGITSIWLMPLAPGPTTHGYAASGYFGLEEDYGTPEDLELLTEAAKSFGLEVIMDLVANHTSDQHPFFQAANKNPQSPLRDWYAFNPDGNYRYAFTFFALPDNNQNNPMVRQNLLNIVDWHMDRGVEGVRCDIAGFTPPSFWRLARKHIKARAPDAVMLAELIPPMPEYFDDGFDLAYDSTTFWNTRDAFAGGSSLDGVDGSLKDATHFVERAQSERARASVRQEDVLFMRYIDNQDEDRFLLRAGGDLRKARAVASSLLTMPGVPLITYGNEVGIEELRGRYPFSKYDEAADRFTDGGVDGLHVLYRKLIAMRRGNRALRLANSASDFQPGNTYLRISSGNDEGGNNVFSTMRFGDGQTFIVLSNRADSTALGSSARVFPPAQLLADFPDQTLTLVDHIDPAVKLTLSRAQLSAPGGVVLNVPAFGSRVFQVTRNGIPDVDTDKVLDSWDNCRGVANANQFDVDRDGVGDRCDACPGTVRGAVVGRDGCAPVAGRSHAHYVLQGSVDDPQYRRAQSGAGNAAISLYASFNGAQLYVATEAAPRGQDTFLVVTDDTGRSVAAPFGKAGTVAGAGLFLADEGDNDFAKWFGATGEAVAATEAIPGRGALEGTINLLEHFGTVPDRVFIAAVRYGGNDGGGVVAQAPAGNGDNVIDASELLPFDLTTEASPVVDPVPGEGEGEGEGNAQPGEGEGEGDAVVIVTPGDEDGDGVENLVDNCPTLHNAGQQDADADGLGDGCDACPISAPGVVVDSRGCGARETPTADVPGFTRPTPRVVEAEARGELETEGCAQGGASSSGLAWGLLALLRRRRRRAS